MNQDVTGLEPGKRYQIDAWVSASDGATAQAQIAVFNPSANVATFSSAFSPVSGWQPVSFVTSSRTGAIRVHLFRKNGSGTIYWDDVSIRQNRDYREIIAS